MGIGVDQIPQNIRHSKVLTGNNLGQLGNVENLPSSEEINAYKNSELKDIFSNNMPQNALLEQELHKKAKQLLDKGLVQDAWKTLLSFSGK